MQKILITLGVFFSLFLSANPSNSQSPETGISSDAPPEVTINNDGTYSVKTSTFTLVFDKDAEVLGYEAARGGEENGDLGLDELFGATFAEPVEPGLLETIAVQQLEACIEVGVLEVHRGHLMDAVVDMGGEAYSVMQRDLASFINMVEPDTEPAFVGSSISEFILEAHRRHEKAQAKVDAEWQRTIREDPWSRIQPPWRDPYASVPTSGGTAEEVARAVVPYALTIGATRLKINNPSTRTAIAVFTRAVADPVSTGIGRQIDQTGSFYPPPPLGSDTRPPLPDRSVLESMKDAFSKVFD